ncbi:peptidase MA family metallohydrolase [Sporosalibacterium faouarense]|uniref:peptidase MA family metallohydrolase n=1 Tax=Sporosalibacterium faouarense TaxID=516123 RepID=UPI00192BA625|nr:peptidase MA family metallohydrolase [Sporosalibacterium faouarense]
MKLKRKARKSIVFVLVIIMTLTVFSLFNLNIKSKFSQLVKAFEKTRILHNVKEYDKLETERFVIRYEDDKKNAELTAKILSKYYDQVCSMFDYYPQEKVVIIIYNNGEDLVDNTRLKKDTPPLGVYYSGTINILSPKVWLSQNESYEEAFEKNGPVVHEFAHQVVDDITNGNYPIWLTEGIALYVEYKTTGFEWGSEIKNGNDITVEDLTNKFYDIDTGLSYRKSFEVVSSISENWGFDKLRLLLDTLGDGNSMDKSTQKVLKVNLMDIDKTLLKE